MYFDINTIFTEGPSIFGPNDIVIKLGSTKLGYINAFAIDESFEGRGFFDFYNLTSDSDVDLRDYTKVVDSLEIFGVNEFGGRHVFFKGMVQFDQSFQQIEPKDIPFEPRNVSSYRIGFTVLTDIVKATKNFPGTNSTFTFVKIDSSSYQEYNLEEAPYSLIGDIRIYGIKD
jgi:hypothetical protein